MVTKYIPASIALLLLSISFSSGLVIRHDTPTLNYETYGKESKFDAATSIARADNWSHGIAGSTAIDSRWGVAARHTLKSIDDYAATGGAAIMRGNRWSGYNSQGLHVRPVEQVIHFFDDFTTFGNAIDIAIVQAQGPLSSLRIAPIYSALDEVGRVGSPASHANNRRDGNEVDRKPENEATSTSDRPPEVRWAAMNDLDRVSGQSHGSPANALLSADMDHPTNASHSRMGGALALDLEAGTMGGDSGSPVYIDSGRISGQVAGVLSGGSGGIGYGSTLVYVRISVYRTWITDSILANPDDRTLSVTMPDQIASVGETVDFLAETTGSESPPLFRTYDFVDPLPGGTIDRRTGVGHWTPTEFDAGTSQTIKVAVAEDGIVAKTTQASFRVTVLPDDATVFWQWSAAPPNWSKVGIGRNPQSIHLDSPLFPYLQGDANNIIYQQISGSLPANATVTMRVKASDFHEEWSTGGPIEVGLLSVMPTILNASEAFANSAVIDVPAYEAVEPLADGLGNTGGNVDYGFTFETTEVLTDPWFAVRKNAPGSRFGIDDILITYEGGDLGTPYDRWAEGYGLDPATDGARTADADGNGLANFLEFALSSDPTDPSSHPAVTLVPTATTLTLKYVKAKAADGTLIRAEWSENLIDWSNAGLTETEIADDAESRTFEVVLEREDRTRLFMRVRPVIP